MSTDNNIIAYKTFLYIYDSTGCDAAYRLAMEYYKSINLEDVMEIIHCFVNTN